MQHKPHLNKSVLAVSITVLLVLAILLLFFLGNRSSKGNEAIILPDPPQEAVLPEVTEETPVDDFVQISKENVRSVLENMSRPSFYHQIYTVTVGADETQAVHVVELWVNGNLLHAEISDGVQTKSVMTDGCSVYLWYEGDEKALSFPLEETIAAEDLLGLLSYETLLSLSPEQITDADYLVLEDPQQVQCLYVCSQDEESVASRYWIDLETGLLYKADVLEMSKQVYTMRQNSFELLAEEDEAFYDRFCLPDGTVPFSRETEMQQP